MPFQGEFSQSLDSKNRIVLPAAFRKELSEDEARRVVVAIGRRAQWLNLYTRKAWLERAAMLEAKCDEDDEDDEKFLRDIYASATDIDLDAQFRFIVPTDRRDRVGIDRDVVFVGVGRRVEIWDQGRYDAYRAEQEGKEGTRSVKK
jgi:MraZ protein